MDFQGLSLIGLCIITIGMNILQTNVPHIPLVGDQESDGIYLAPHLSGYDLTVI